MTGRAPLPASASAYAVRLALWRDVHRAIDVLCTRMARRAPAKAAAVERFRRSQRARLASMAPDLRVPANNDCPREGA
jgi:hypothetical protein